MGGKRTIEPFKRAFGMQKSNANTRGVPFLLTFDQWKAIWVESGKFEQRGRGSDKFCMCRNNDTGAYEVGNVFIDTNHRNISDGNLGKPCSDEHRTKISLSNLGKAHPWSAGENSPMRRPEVKAKVIAAISGAKHYKARGVVTPQGFFPTAKSAAEALGMKKPTVEWRARHNKFGFSLPA